MITFGKLIIIIAFLILAKGLPPEEKHSRDISVSSVVLSIFPLSIKGGSGGTITFRLAAVDRMEGKVLVASIWHSYTASSDIVISVISKLYSPEQI